jgi:hypothetical protein
MLPESPDLTSRDAIYWSLYNQRLERLGHKFGDRFKPHSMSWMFERLRLNFVHASLKGARR